MSLKITVILEFFESGTFWRLLGGEYYILENNFLTTFISIIKLYHQIWQNYFLQLFITPRGCFRGDPGWIFLGSGSGNIQNGLKYLCTNLYNFSFKITWPTVTLSTNKLYCFCVYKNYQDWTPTSIHLVFLCSCNKRLWRVTVAERAAASEFIWMKASPEGWAWEYKKDILSNDLKNKFRENTKLLSYIYKT